MLINKLKIRPMNKILFLEESTIVENIWITPDGLS